MPKTSYFNVSYRQNTMLAPGLESKIDVEFRAKPVKDYYDKIVIISGENKIEVPLSALAPAPRITFDSFVNMGVVVAGSSSTRFVSFRNEGIRKGNVEIKWDPSIPLSISPSSFELASLEDEEISESPSSSNVRKKTVQRVKIDFTGSEIGDFRELVEVVTSESVQANSLDIHAKVVDERVELRTQENGDILRSVEFGELYYGETEDATSELVNCGPNEVMWRMDDSEDASRTFSVTPREGTLQPYGKQTLRFIFAPRSHPDMKGFASRTTAPASTKLTSKRRIVCGNIRQQIDFEMCGQASFPSVQVSPRGLINFYDCSVGDHRDVVLTLKNLCETMPASLSFDKVAHFTTNLSATVLGPLESKTIVVTFCPTQMGRLRSALRLNVNGGIQVVAINVEGRGTRFGSGVAPATKSGTETLRLVESEGATSLAHARKIKQMSYARAKAARRRQAMPWTNPEVDTEGMKNKGTQFGYSVKQMHERYQHKKTYDNYLSSKRTERIERLRTLRSPKRSNTVEAPGVDLGLMTALREPKISLPPIPKELWLRAPELLNSKIPLRRHDPMRKFRRKFATSPRKQVQIRECKKSLSGDELKRVSLGPDSIDFGTVCRLSSTTRTYSVFNDLQQSVFVKILTADVDELSETSITSQVIPANCAAGFDISFKRDTVGAFERKITALINGQHSKRFSVRASVVPLRLDVSKSRIRFEFVDSNLESSVSELITLRNPGNSPAMFEFITENECFTVSPPSDVVPAFGKMEALVTFSPQLSRPCDGTIKMNVKDGESNEIRCSGVVHETKIRPDAEMIDFGTVAVGMCHTKTLTITNERTNSAVFWVSCEIPGVSVEPRRGRLDGLGSTQLKINILSDMETSFVSALFRINARFGLPQMIKVSATVRTPKVHIREDEFDFGEVAIGARVLHPVHVDNVGNVPSILMLNMAAREDFMIAANSLDDPTEKYDPSAAITETRLVPVASQGSSFDHPKLFRLEILPGESLTFSLVFQPKSATRHGFEFPISFVGIPNVSSLRRVVMATGVTSRVALSSRVVDFGETIVARDCLNKSTYHRTVSIKNVSEEAFEWRLDEKALRESGKGFFEVSPTRGTLGVDEAAKIRFDFTASGANEYAAVAPLYLEGLANRPYLEVPISAQAVYPKLFFETTNIVLSPVPLDVVAKKTFYVHNSGYENLEVRYHMPKDENTMPMTLSFPEGQLLGSTKTKIPVVVCFSSKKPLSFTSRIDFLDDESNKFSVNISGSADNCLLTNFSFVSQHSRTERDVRDCCEDNEVFDDADDATASIASFSSVLDKDVHDDNVARWSFVRSGDAIDEDTTIHFKPLSVSGASISNILYPKPLSRRCLDFFVRWLNTNVLERPLLSFPGYLRDDNGATVIELVETLSGKKVKFDVASKDLTSSRSELISQLRGQFSALLVHLESFGALLHSIHPDDLLSKDAYIRTKTPKSSLQNMYDTRLSAGILKRRKMIEEKFASVSVESWCTLLFQIVRTFMLRRVYPKWYATLPGVEAKTPAMVSGEATKEAGANSSVTKTRSRRRKRSKKRSGMSNRRVPSALRSSNVYSVSENLLRRWVEHHFKRVNPSRSARCVRCFAEAMTDGTLLCSLLLSHCPHLSRRSGGPMGPILFEEDAKRTNESEEVFDEDDRVEMSASDIASRNISSAINGMRALKLEFVPTASDFVNASPRDMVLLLLSLITTLPAFVPKATIKFDGVLGKSTQKHLVLRNPSKNILRYEASIEGDPSYRVESRMVVIEPKSKKSLPIEFNPRFSKASRARLVLRSKRKGVFSAATLVFKTVSSSAALDASQSMRCETQTYEPKVLNVNVRNPFDVPGEFKLSCVSAESVASELFPDAFFIEGSEMKLEAGASKTLTLYFLPWFPGRYTSHISFVDNDVGEFHVELQGVAQLPMQESEVSVRVDFEQNILKDIELPKKNAKFEEARKFILDRRGAKGRVDIEKQLQSLLAATSTYEISVDSPYITCTQRETAGSMTKSSDTLVLGLGIRPKGAGTYNGRVVLRSHADVRVLDIFATVAKSSEERELTFEAPARQTIEQAIPIYNNTDEPWTLMAQFSGSAFFSGPHSLIVPAHSNASYKLSFKPLEICESTSCKLSLQNKNVSFDFNLKGAGNEPLAEDHIVVACKARTQGCHKFLVRNFASESRTFNVVSDIPNVSGDSTVVVPAKSEKSYLLQFSPLVGGTYSGTVTFEDPKSKTSFQWYTVEIQAESSDPEDTIKIETAVRNAASVEITLSNPLKDDVTFDVYLAGEGLMGETSFSLAAGTEKSYEVVFAPIRPGASIGSVTFVSKAVGEIWYQLELVGTKAPPKALEHVRCDIGSYYDIPMELENPTNAELKLQGTCSNSPIFQIVQPRITLKPYAKIQALLRYRPSNLDGTETSRVVWKNERLGMLVFEASGNGQMPSKSLSPFLIYGPVSKTSSSSITFANPFPKPLEVRISLEATSAFFDESLKLLLREHSSVVLKPFGSIRIPVAFSPKSVREVNASLRISCADDSLSNLSWVIPIRGIAECLVKAPKKIALSCRARQSSSQIVSLSLKDLKDVVTTGDEIETFSFDYSVSSQNEAFVRNALKVSQLETRDVRKNQVLTFKFDFRPLCAFRESGEFIVIGALGGRWRIKMELEALEPEVDDVIVIESEINCTASVTFGMNNIESTSTPFKAYFTPESPLEFSIYPEQGVLEGLGTAPTDFTVSLSPKEYGRILVGKLVIQTEKMMWSYEVRGKPPRYSKPKNVRSKVVSTRRVGITE
eukprot:g1239.t1